MNLKKDKATLAQFIKCKEAADILGVTRNTAKQRVIDGLLDCQYLGDEMLFYLDQVKALALVE